MGIDREGKEVLPVGRGQIIEGRIKGAGGNY